MPARPCSLQGPAPMMSSVPAEIWLIQRGDVAIPKSVRPERMAQNLDIFEFQLTEDQMATIAGLDTDTSIAFDHRDPAMVTRLSSVRLDA
jgi:2,5-diketo-D-gluconate reductase A